MTQSNSIQLDVVVGTWNVNSQEPLEEIRHTVYHTTYDDSLNNSSSSSSSSDRSTSPHSSTDIYNDTFRLEEQEYKVKTIVIKDIEAWLKLDEKLSDIYAIGFQEIEMTGKALVTEQTEQRLKWEHTLRTVFCKQKEPYLQLCVHQLVGLCLVIYVKRKHISFIDNVRNCIIREDHPIIFVFGDFNYRIDNSKGNWTTQEIQNKIQDGRLKFLLRFDQLTTELSKDHLLLKKWGFVEGEINFAPTYKYITGSDMYDSEQNAEKIGKTKSASKLILGSVKKKKDRIPSWTDRIFYKNIGENYDNFVCEQQDYGRFESKLSDHKPVFATFCVKYTESSTEKSERARATSSAAPPPVPKHLLNLKKSASNTKLIDFDSEDALDTSPTKQPIENNRPIGAGPTYSKVEQMRSSFDSLELSKQGNRSVTTTTIDSALKRASTGDMSVSKRASLGKPLPVLPPRPSDIQQALQQQSLQHHQQQSHTWQPPAKPLGATRGQAPVVHRAQATTATATTTTGSATTTTSSSSGGFNPRALDRSRAMQKTQQAAVQPQMQQQQQQQQFQQYSHAYQHQQHQSNQQPNLPPKPHDTFSDVTSSSDVNTMTSSDLLSLDFDEFFVPNSASTVDHSLDLDEFF